MTAVILLERLAAFTEEVTKDLIMPTKMQDGDDEPIFRSAEVHKMRLPDSRSAKKKAPYIIHQVITGKDTTASSAVVRSIFCVYNEREDEGGLMLLNLMERVRIALLKAGTVGEQFTLDINAGMERMIYPDDTAPFYAGEMISTWKMPRVEREVIL